MIAHLLRCASIRSPRYACDCGADAQNELAARLDQAEADPLADIPEAERVAIQVGAERARRETGMRTTAPWCGQAAYDGFVKLAADAYRARQATPPPDTPLRAVARMLDRLLLATAYAAVELAATLSPAEAIRVLDEVEPSPTPAGCAFCSTLHDPGDCCQA